ncbi:glycosyltransferase [Candidatus Marithrix sp. Canyon 246]|uniref:glycosyltransferase n=1 Tax=Candidatus Marithrix sp. Canyon 246 TaxID=1827136 RepID=UPI000B3369E2|nr:glycosyltransferase [Candidatus Marithrix sp. Canyon 246]
MARVLYITYDGLLEPLGQSQVLQYLKKLAESHEITLLSYEKAADWKNISKLEGIRWIPLRYHKSPTALATSYDLLRGLFVCTYLSIRYRIQIVHARSYVPSVLALALKRIFKKRFIFDMRGFWADEKRDTDTWQPNSRIYRVSKWFEKQFLTNADVVVSLTHAGVSTMKQFPYLKDSLPRFEVISTCTNLELFRPIPQQNNKLFTLGYVGTTTNWYIFDPVIECFKILLQIRPNSRFLIINKGEHEYIKERLNAHAISKDQVELRTAEYSEVPLLMSEMDASIFFIKPVFSKLASAPTKLGEFLGCGIPCIVNAGVGDMGKILNEENVGIVIDEFSSQELEKAVLKLIKLIEQSQIQTQCITVASKYFSLDEGFKKYNQIYNSLLLD